MLSHVKIYDQIIQNNHQITCVLEDDAQPTPSFADILNYEELKKLDWEVLLLGHQSPITLYLFRQYYKWNLKPAERTRRRPLIDAYNFGGAVVKNPVPIYMKNHYIAKPQGNSTYLCPRSTMAYLIKLSAAKKLKKIAVLNQKSLYIDNITGHATNYGVSLKLVTPSCVKVNPTYGRTSLVFKAEEYATWKENIYKSKLPDEKLLQLYIRNQWRALVISFCTLKIRLGLVFLINLVALKYMKIRQIFSSQ